MNLNSQFAFPFQVMANGNLVLPPFRAEDYNQEVHAQAYRCIAQNALGKIQSRDVHVRAGTDNISLTLARKLTAAICLDVTYIFVATKTLHLKLQLTFGGTSK